MAKYLLDTHAAIWFFEENDQLSPLADSAIRNFQNKIYLNIGSIWEIAIKLNIGKLKLEVTIEEFCLFCISNNIQIVPILINHLKTYLALPLLHRDPFDRLIIANAITDNFEIITKDPQIGQYSIPTLW